MSFYYLFQPISPFSCRFAVQNSPFLLFPLPSTAIKFNWLWLCHVWRKNKSKKRHLMSSRIYWNCLWRICWCVSADVKDERLSRQTFDYNFMEELIKLASFMFNYRFPCETFFGCVEGKAWSIKLQNLILGYSGFALLESLQAADLTCIGTRSDNSQINFVLSARKQKFSLRRSKWRQVSRLVFLPRRKSSI